MTKPQSQDETTLQQQNSPSSASPEIYPLTTTQQLNDAREIVREEAEALRLLADRINSDFCKAVQLLVHSTGTVVITGVGKAGLIGQKIVATLSSTGTRSMFLHPTEALHGDLGCIASNDIVVAISNSGRSEEILKLIPVLRRRSTPVIAMTRDHDSELAQKADVVLEIGRHREAGDLQLAPSVSTTAMLALGDALALVVSKAKGFTKWDFAESHPAGNLGRQLQPVSEVMRTGEDLRTAADHETVRSVMIERSRPGRRTGAVLLTSPSGQLSGIFTDSDLARLFEQRREHLIDQPITDVMSANPTTIHQASVLPDAVELMKRIKISELPVVDDSGFPVGLIDITDIIDVSPVSPDKSSTEPGQSNPRAARRTA